jgi:hypothetical protein
VPVRQPTIQTIAWIVDLDSRGLLDLDPPYQRRSVWNQAFRDRFIDTILNGYPIPPIFLHREIDAEGLSTYHVIDGRQRLETVLQYVRGAFPTPESYTPLAGQFFRDLPDETKRSVWDYQVQVEFLTGTEEPGLQEVFDRLNRNVAQLKPQELRHAKFNGAFLQLTEHLAERLPDILPSGFPNIPELRRMRDVEYVATLVLYLERGARGTSQADLDAAYATWDEALPDLRFDARFEETLDGIRQLLVYRDDLGHTRLRNLTDFYSLFAAVANLLSAGWLPSQASAVALLQFVNRVEAVRTAETDPQADPEAAVYYEAARSAVNDAGPREARIAIVMRVLSAPT